jgi:proteasome assembly chaperone (PAC2) family protein
MKITIKNIIKENNTPEEKFINGIVNFIKLPYFYNLRVNEVPEKLWVRILSKIFNQEVSVSNNGIYDSNDNQIYFEDSDGFWIKRQFDKNNNLIYFETSDGFWWKREYDKNNNVIYYENSNGFWSKQEFDKNNNQIYYENSDGKIIDNRPSNPLNENIDITPEEKFINGISNFIKPPYFYNLRVNEVPEELWDRILSKVYNQKVSVSENYIYDKNNNLLYYEDSNGYWEKREFDKNNNQIYYENSSGYWWKREYDSNNNEIYFENSGGYWWKREYDKNNNEIYFEDSDGKIIDNRPSNPLNENITPEEKYINGLSNFIKPPYFYNLRVNEVPRELWVRILSKVFNQEVSVINNGIYDSNNNEIYYEHSDGYWWKREYDNNGNRIYYEDSDGFWWKQEFDKNNNLLYRENSDGYWRKREFDKNNNRIYYEDSNGTIMDNRPSNPLNENIDLTPEEKFINGIVNFIKLPYFYNLRVNEVPRELWVRILSKIFNQEVREYNNSIYDENNNKIYYEDSDGDWWKREYDENNNKIYYENSDGYWWKREYDKNNNQIYFENSNGDWEKREYDSNNNLLYREDSTGYIMDNRPISSINENIDITPEEKYINGLSNMIRTPYFYNLRVNEVPEELWDRILSKIFNQEVSVSNNSIYNSNNNKIYYENSDGNWSKREYDENNNRIYFENSDGNWVKREYDGNDNEIYYENSDGKIIDNRPSNPLNENIDLTPEEKYINGIVNFIKLPYFNFLRVNEVPEELWVRILSKIFNQEVEVSENYNIIYDSNNNEIYYEDSDGYWIKHEFDKNNNEIYFENSNGNWEKQEFDKNNNRIYYERSNGYWSKKEYDKNNNPIYFENSNGKIIDNRPSNPLNENIDITPEEKFINGLSNMIRIPYFYNLRVNEVPRELWVRVLSKVYNQEVSVSVSEYDNYLFDSNNNEIYYENSDGYWVKREFDKNDNLIYRESSNGFWEKQEFDKNNNQIYFENSDGDIRDNRPISSINENIDITPEEKFINGIVNFIKLPYFYNLRVNEVPRELWNEILSKVYNQEVSVSNNSIFDKNDNLIYYENSDGNWFKQEFDSNNNPIYREYLNGYWIKKEYDSNNNEIYSENSDGYWIKREFDSNNNEIYLENSDGTIRDNRSSSSINENITPEEKFINGLSNFIKPPYFYNLRVNEVPEELWDRILSKIYRQEVSVSVSNNSIYDSNNNEIYYENSDGDWRKQEFDKNNNPIYYENSDGYWWKREYDKNNNPIYYENSNGYWWKREYDKNNNEIYYEDSDGNIIDYRPSNPLNENIDLTPEEKYINGISNMIRTPYFYNLRVNEVPEELWDRILSKIYSQEVSVSENYIYNSNNNEIYRENSDGNWIIREFDSNNNLLYREDSTGYIMDNRPSNPLNENIDFTPEEKYINGISNFIKLPYFYNLRVNEVPEELWDRILSKIFNQEVEVSENYNIIFDENNNQIYFEDSDGFWEKLEFDKNNNPIYYEDSTGFWWKREYDSNNNQIYYENSDGDIMDDRSSNPLNENITPEEKFINGIVNFIKPPYFYNLRVNEVPRELWVRILSKVYNQEVREYNNYIYDKNNNRIYYENSNGDWEKREYDSNNNRIYYENSDGDIMDDRSSSSINENNTI